MSELARALTGDSAAAPAAHILEGLGADVIGRKFEGVPHTIYQELWHLAFWQQISLDWIRRKRDALPCDSFRWLSRRGHDGQQRLEGSSRAILERM